MKLCGEEEEISWPKRVVTMITVLAIGAAIVAASLHAPNTHTSGAPECTEVQAGVRMPLMFIENQGQWDSEVAYMARKRGMTAWLLKDGITFQFEKHNVPDHVQGVTLHLNFENASEWVSLVGEEKQPTKHNFFIGNDRAKWCNGVSSYAQVIYRNLYDDIDLCVREATGWLEYDLLLSEDADLSDVVIRCDGLKGLGVDENGILVMETEFGPMTQKPAKAWYETFSGDRIPVACNFRIIDDERYGFEVEQDLGLTLVIDPGLEWSTFLGADMDDEVYAVALNAAGDVITAGLTNSDSFPTTPGAYDTTHSGGLDGFVSCLSADGTQLLWSTYLGGPGGIDFLFDLAVDDSGRVTVAGMTNSPYFPTTPGAYDTSYNGGFDAFVTRLNAVGSQLTYSTFLGASEDDWAMAVEVNGSGEAFVGGYTGSSNFPTTPNAYDTNYNGGVKDAFVAHLNAAGSDLVYSSFLGGTYTEGWDIQNPFINTRVMGLALDNSGEVVVTGFTQSNDFPTTPGAYDTTQNGGYDMFVTRLNENGSDLVYSTFFGGSSNDGPYSSEVGLDASGVVTVAGWTESSDLPTTAGAYDTTFNGYVDGFVARLDATAHNLLYSTFIGASGYDDINGYTLEASGEVIITGCCQAGYPTTPGAYDTTYNGGNSDAYISRLSPDGNGQADLIYSTFLGGSGSLEEYTNALAYIDNTTVIVAGRTVSTDFPTMPGAYDTTYNGGYDGFICRFGVSVGIEERPEDKPFAACLLNPMFPNPTSTELHYTVNLTQTTNIKVWVVDVTGRVIETLIDSQLSTGIHYFSWHPSKEIACGIYFLRVQTCDYSATEKILLVR